MKSIGPSSPGKLALACSIEIAVLNVLFLNFVRSLLENSQSCGQNFNYIQPLLFTVIKNEIFGAQS